MIANVVVVNTEDDGTQRNKVRSFRVVDADVPADDYSPDDPAEGEGDDEHLDAAGRDSTQSKPFREPGEDDDLDTDGFDWRQGAQIKHTSSLPLLDAVSNGRSKAS
jgi:hypothetical protein